MNMVTVNVQINNKNYHLECSDADQARLKDVAHQFDLKIKEFRRLSPQVSSELAIIICAIGVLDELNELKQNFNSKSDLKEEFISDILSDYSNKLNDIHKKIKDFNLKN